MKGDTLPAGRGYCRWLVNLTGFICTCFCYDVYDDGGPEIRTLEMVGVDGGRGICQPDTAVLTRLPSIRGPVDLAIRPSPGSPLAILLGSRQGISFENTINHTLGSQGDSSRQLQLAHVVHQSGNAKIQRTGLKIDLNDPTTRRNSNSRCSRESQLNFTKTTPGHCLSGVSCMCRA